MIYLAIPYTGIEEASFEIANRVAGAYMNEGNFVFSPITHCHPIAQCCDLPKDWEFWQRFDIMFLRNCDYLVVVTIPGWKESTGVQAEIKMAKTLDIPILYAHVDIHNDRLILASVRNYHLVCGGLMIEGDFINDLSKV